MSNRIQEPMGCWRREAVAANRALFVAMSDQIAAWSDIRELCVRNDIDTWPSLMRRPDEMICGEIPMKMIHNVDRRLS